MKAMRFHEYGDSGVLVYEDVDRPVAGPGQVVIKVAGSAFNPLDVAIRAGFVQEAFPVTLPHTPDIDVSGVITEVGAGVTAWHVGDAVVAYLPITAPGAAAEYVAAPADLLAKAPRTVELADAAALPSPALTAWQSLFEYGGLRAGQSLLVNGAGGAVGGYAVQLAKEAGAEVTATASPRSEARLRDYGADRVIDHTAAPLQKAVAGQKFDVVLDLIRSTPEEAAALADLAADGGVFVSTTFPEIDKAGRGVRIATVYSRSDGAQLAALVARVDEGALKIDVAQRRPLTDLPALHDQASPASCQARPS